MSHLLTSRGLEAPLYNLAWCTRFSQNHLCLLRVLLIGDTTCVCKNTIAEAQAKGSFSSVGYECYSTYPKSNKCAYTCVEYPASMCDKPEGQCRSLPMCEMKMAAAPSTAVTKAPDADAAIKAPDASKAPAVSDAVNAACKITCETQCAAAKAAVARAPVNKKAMVQANADKCLTTCAQARTAMGCYRRDRRAGHTNGFCDTYVLINQET